MGGGGVDIQTRICKYGNLAAVEAKLHVSQSSPRLLPTTSDTSLHVILRPPNLQTMKDTSRPITTCLHKFLTSHRTSCVVHGKDSKLMSKRMQPNPRSSLRTHDAFKG